MALTDVQIRSLKPADKPYKMADERGHYLEVSPNGSKLWRYKYGFMGKNKRIALGRYPQVGLAEARRRRIEARESLDNGIDPLANRKREKLIAVYQAANTFGDMAKEYLEKMVGDQRAETTISKAHWLLEQLKPIADQPITSLKPVDVLAALKRLEAHSKFETARRCRSFASRVFRYAVATRRGETDPTSMLRGALVVPRTTHHAALLEPKDARLLRARLDPEWAPISCRRSEPGSGPNSNGAILAIPSGRVVAGRLLRIFRPRRARGILGFPISFCSLCCSMPSSSAICLPRPLAEA